MGPALAESISVAPPVVPLVAPLVAPTVLDDLPRDLLAFLRGPFRQPLLRGFGRPVILGLCGYEIAALVVPWLPTISEVVDRYPIVGGLLLLALAHHWFIEQDREAS